jgi:hypothetical protein
MCSSTALGRLLTPAPLKCGAPDAQRTMPRGEREVSICGQQSQFVSYAQLAQKRVDRPNFDACPPANVANIRGVNVILPIWHQER